MSTKTTNYSLILASGTDVYNHLTVDNPNYSAIDKQMKVNADNSVPKATVTKSSNTFAITRNPKTAVFWFVAGAAYTLGNTITVDGTTVTAALPDGSQLPTNAWRVNSNVLCILQGTQLTVFSSAIDMGAYMPKTGGDFTGAVTGTSITASTVGGTTLKMGNNSIKNVVVDEGDSGGWHWRKWSNGRAELSGKFNCAYANPNVLTKTVAYPFSFECDSCATGLNNALSNASRAMAMNVKASIYGGSITLTVHDPNGSFGNGEELQVTAQATGTWK